MNSKRTPAAPLLITAVIGGLCLASCVRKPAPVPEAEYATKLIGCWQGTVGDDKETMALGRDGTFVCQLHPMGFIANTLCQGVTGTIRGTWTLTGATITLRITGADNESLKNRITTSRIVALSEDALTLKSDRGDTSPFHRVNVF